MRISELLGSGVVDEHGQHVGRIHDVRLTLAREGPDRQISLEVKGLVVGPSGPLARAAHAWGYAEGRAQGPLLLKALTKSAVRDSRFIPAERVLDWHSPELRITGSAKDLQPLRRDSGE